MTSQEWLELKVGDVIIDHLCGSIRRTVLSLSRVSGRQGQKAGKARTTIAVPNVKTRGRETLLVSSADVFVTAKDGSRIRRFELVPYEQVTQAHTSPA